MEWFFINWQYILHLYIIGAIIVGSLNALTYLIGLSHPNHDGLNPIEMALFYVDFTCGFLIWPAVMIKNIGAVLSGILARIRRGTLWRSRNRF